MLLFSLLFSCVELIFKRGRKYERLKQSKRKKNETPADEEEEEEEEDEEKETTTSAAAAAVARLLLLLFVLLVVVVIAVLRYSRRRRRHPHYSLCVYFCVCYLFFSLARRCKEKNWWRRRTLGFCLGGIREASTSSS